MAKGQVSISTKGEMANVLAEAYRAFPDASRDSQALTRALFHWYYARQENSKRGALTRIEQKLDKVLDILADTTGQGEG